MYRHIDRATSDVQAHEPLSADVQAATLMSLSALLAIPSNSTPNDGAYRRFSAHLQPPARSDFEAPIRLAGQEGAVQIASVEKFIRSS